MVSEYYGRPEGGVADIWFGSTHDDTFGAFNVSPYAKLDPSRRVLSSVATADVLERRGARKQLGAGLPGMARRALARDPA